MNACAPPPEQCRLALKEWAGVCRAVAEGRQFLLFRKGGIADSGGLSISDHEHFWLYPTWSHQAQAGLRTRSDQADPHPIDRSGMLAIQVIARAEHVVWCGSLETLRRIEEFHVWTEEAVERRFHYRRPGLWVVLLRAWVTEVPFLVKEELEDAGCHSWVTLRDPLSSCHATPVQSAAEFRKAVSRILSLLEPEATSG